MKRSSRPLGAALAALLLLASCGADQDSDSSDGLGRDDGGDAGDAWTSEGGEAPATDGIYLDASDDLSSPAPAEPRAVDGGLSSEADLPADRPRAGSVDDNELWDEYLLYRQEFAGMGIPFSDLPVDGRQILSVVDADGDPVLGATISIATGDGSGVARMQTYADGRAVFLGDTAVDPDDQTRPELVATVTKGDISQDFALGVGVAQSLVLDVDVVAPAQLDVLFLIDATGSMGDEIERLKASAISVSEQLAALPSAPQVRFGSVTYRDRGEEYVTRTFDFTDDVAAFTDALEGVVADGGGDTPEALGAGLDAAITEPSWRGDDTVKLVFLLGDAAPHLAGEPGYEDEPDYAQSVRNAAAAGIKVFPIASSGLDDQGEYIFRQLAQVTMGRFVFLTYGADGVSPGDSTTHHVDPADYDVLALDDLVVQLAADELAPLTEHGD